MFFWLIWFLCLNKLYWLPSVACIPPPQITPTQPFSCLNYVLEMCVSSGLLFSAEWKESGTWTQDEICFVLLNLALTTCTVSTCSRVKELSLMLSCSKTTILWLRSTTFKWCLLEYVILSNTNTTCSRLMTTKYCISVFGTEIHLFVRCHESGNSHFWCNRLM